MSNYITTHNASGQTVYQSLIPDTQHLVHQVPFGTISFIYTTTTIPANLSSEADLESYAQTRQTGIPGGQPAPPGGTSAAIISLKPGAAMPLRRTATLGYMVILEGTVELVLDSGETRTLKAGDTCVQRGGMHGWKNVTPDGGWVRMFGVAQASEVIEIGGKRLEPGFAAT